MKPAERGHKWELNFEFPTDASPLYKVDVWCDRDDEPTQKRYIEFDNAQEFYLTKLKKYFKKFNDEYGYGYTDGVRMTLNGVDTLDDLLQAFVPYMAHAMAAILETKDQEPAGLTELLRLARNA